MSTILALLPASARLYTSVLSGIRRRLCSKFELQIVDYPMDSPTLRKLLRFWNPAGCIVVAAEGFPGISVRDFRDTPTVFLDRTPLTPGNFLDVTQNYEENGREAARELIQHDLHDYAYVGYRSPTHWSRIRGRAFANSIRLQGKTCRTFDEGANCGERTRLLERWICELPKPVGVFTANDHTAGEVHAICVRNRIPIPDDVSLLGIDNIADICESASPKISSILSDFEQGGWICADLLLERIANPRMRRAHRHYPTLGIVSRASTRKSGAYSPQVLRAANAIRARACEGITVDDVATDMGCSRRLAEIRFRNATGTTIKRAITEARLELAKVLLKDRGLSLKDVATACGYGTENALRIAFKKRFGATLTAGRNGLS